MKKIIFVLLVFSVMGFIGCNSDSDGETGSTTDVKIITFNLVKGEYDAYSGYTDFFLTVTGAEWKSTVFTGGITPNNYFSATNLTGKVQKLYRSDSSTIVSEGTVESINFSTYNEYVSEGYSAGWTINNYFDLEQIDSKTLRIFPTNHYDLEGTVNFDPPISAYPEYSDLFYFGQGWTNGGASYQIINGTKVYFQKYVLGTDSITFD